MRFRNFLKKSYQTFEKCSPEKSYLGSWPYEEVFILLTHKILTDCAGNSSSSGIRFYSRQRITIALIVRSGNDRTDSHFTGSYAGFGFFGVGLTRKMGVVHKNFISFVAMVI